MNNAIVLLLLCWQTTIPPKILKWPLPPTFQGTRINLNQLNKICKQVRKGTKPGNFALNPDFWRLTRIWETDKCKIYEWKSGFNNQEAFTFYEIK